MPTPQEKQKLKDAALVECNKKVGAAYDECEKKTAPAYEERTKKLDAADAEYKKRLAEINAMPDDVPKEITQDGHRYKLVEE